MAMGANGKDIVRSIFWVILIIRMTSSAFPRQPESLTSHRDPYHIYTYANHPCRRRCQGGVAPMTCRYYFLLEHFSTMAKECTGCPQNPARCNHSHCIPANGVVRGILTVNRMLPGPLIYVCEGDIIEVLVDNKMELGEGTSVHWHGLKQRGTQFMDGTNLVTQCPIHSGSKMLYRFRAADKGTHFWHAHSAIQRSGGIFGGLIVRQPKSRDLHGHRYDLDLPEHFIMLSDWQSKTVGETFSRNFFSSPVFPDTILVNGIGRVHSGPPIPYPVFHVTAGQRYRFRIASNGVMNCPIVLSIDHHRLLVIASDGHEVGAVHVDSLVIYGGERFDVVFSAEQHAHGNFWIRFKGQGRCEEARVFQAAILRYEGAPPEEPSPPATFNNTAMGRTILNDARSTPSPRSLQITDLRSLAEDDEDPGLLRGPPDKQFYLAMGSSQIETPRFDPWYPDVDDTLPSPTNDSLSVPLRRAPVSVNPKDTQSRGEKNASDEYHTSIQPIVYHFNYILSILPPSPPLSQLEDIPKEMFCNNDTVTKDCSTDVCECVHRLQFQLGDLVEVILVGYRYGPAHPIHMHGHAFRTVSMMAFNRSVTVDEIKRMDRQGEISRISSQAPVKDNVVVRNPGLTIVRFRASNPGFWLLHCHIDFHAETGMMLILQSGDIEDMPRPPPTFPRCGDWFPDAHSSNVAARKRSNLGGNSRGKLPTPHSPSGPLARLVQKSSKNRRRPSLRNTNSDSKTRYNKRPKTSVAYESRLLSSYEISSLNYLNDGDNDNINDIDNDDNNDGDNDNNNNKDNNDNNLHLNNMSITLALETLAITSSLPTTLTEDPLTSSSPTPDAPNDLRPHLLFMTSVFIGLVLVMLVAATYAGRGCCPQRRKTKQLRKYCGDATIPDDTSYRQSLRATFRRALILDTKPADYQSILAEASSHNGE